MTLNEVISMFEQFGFHEQHVRRALAAGDSAFNAFEGLKMTLQLQWGDMCQELSVDRQKELRPIYDRLMKISMKSRTTQSEVKRAEAHQSINIADRMKDRLDDHRKQNLAQVTHEVRSQIRKMKQTEGMSPEAERRARAMGLFDDDEEI